MKISAVIIDDDKDSRLILREFVESAFPEIIVIGESWSVEESIHLIKKLKPELLLLDISLPDGTAFDLLRSLPNRNFEVIFITAFDRYAIEAFRFSAIDYLLKPVGIEDLNDALKRVKSKLADRYFRTHWETLTHNLLSKEVSEKRLAIATAGDYTFINVSEIVRLESQSNYTLFFLKNSSKIVSSRNLGYYESILPEDIFCRIHHSHIVNSMHIKKYVRSGIGGYLLMSTGDELPVSQRRKNETLEYLLKLIGFEK